MNSVLESRLRSTGEELSEIAVRDVKRRADTITNLATRMVCAVCEHLEHGKHERLEVGNGHDAQPYVTTGAVNTVT